jgi:hypothetical protein
MVKHTLAQDLAYRRTRRRISDGWTGLPGTGLVVDVVRWLVERRLPELIVASVTGHPEMPDALAAFVCFLRRRAEARFPLDLRPAGPQLVTKRATSRLVIEHEYGH